MMKSDPQIAALSPVAAELARIHSADCLFSSLLERLRIDGRENAADVLAMYWNDSGKTGLDAGHIAGALITRLRADGMHEVAGALSSLLRDAGVAPVFSHPVPLEEYKDHPNATLFLRGPLLERLRVDGHQELALAVTELIVGYAPEAPAGVVDLAAKMASPERVDRGPTSGDVPLLMPEDVAHPWEIAAAQDTRSLLDALLARLQKEGRDAKAGDVMLGWLRGVAGPLVDPRGLADALIERLRTPPTLPADLVGQMRVDSYPKLADAMQSLLDEALIDRDLREIMRTWEQEVTGPIVKARPLAAALVHALHLPGHAEHPQLADAVLSLLENANPPILSSSPPHPGRIP